MTADSSRKPILLSDSLIPLDEHDSYIPHYLDSGGTVHWFSVVDATDEPEPTAPYALHYFRATQTEQGQLIHDSHPIMPVHDPDRIGFPLPTLHMMLEEGDLENAQELAYHTAQAHGLPFPDPLELPELNPKADYYFGMDAADDGSLRLQGVKTWLQGSERRFDTFIISQHGVYEAAQSDERELYGVLGRDGLEVAMNLAEQMAVAGGHLDPEREDSRVFFAEEAPIDPFTTLREREMTSLAIDAEPEQAEAIYRADTHMEGAAWFEQTFEQAQFPLLQPIDETVNYGVVVQEADPWTLELAVEKYWREHDGQLGIDSLTLQRYEPDEIEHAEADRITLLKIHDERGLEAIMHRAELTAMEHADLDGDRVDTRLFMRGPEDRFEALSQRLHDEPNPYFGIGDDHMLDETQSLTAALPEPGGWDELVAQQSSDEPEPERHYWQMHFRPVETPAGQPLGTALFVTEFPQLPPDFGDYIEENGMDDSIYPTKAHTLEIANFANDDDAYKFAMEFRSYLMPGLLDGPELASEVAKLEGLTGEWKDMDYQGIVEYISGNRTIVREESEWHLHNPNAEREARSLTADSSFEIDV